MQSASYLFNMASTIDEEYPQICVFMFGIEHPSLVLTLSTKGKEAFVSKYFSSSCSGSCSEKKSCLYNVCWLL